MPKAIKSVLMFGDPEGEHLRIDRKGDDLILISRELRLGSNGAQQSTWYEKPYVTASVEQWQKLIKELGDSNA